MEGNWPWWVAAPALYLVIICLVPLDWVERQVVQERQIYVAHLGGETAVELITVANQRYQRWFEESGVHAAIRNAMIPSDEERQASKGLENLGSATVFPYFESRVDAFHMICYIAILRGSSLVIWWPLLVPMMLAAMNDGYQAWRKKRYTFEYTSPLLHRSAWRTFVYLPAMLWIFLIIPIVISPMVMPMLCGVFAGLAMLFIRNTQKRI
jgi:hypothetical protein